jgi:hypothetical protein
MTQASVLFADLVGWSVPSGTQSLIPIPPTSLLHTLINPRVGRLFVSATEIADILTVLCQQLGHERRDYTADSAGDIPDESPKIHSDGVIPRDGSS